jgi:hypothetical protein
LFYLVDDFLRDRKLIALDLTAIETVLESNVISTFEAYATWHITMAFDRANLEVT